MAVLLDKQQVRASFAKASNSYDAMAALQRKVGQHLFSGLSIDEKTHILDLGCGTGFFAQLISKSTRETHIYALDIALPMLAKTKKREQCENVRLVCADAERLPFIDNSMQLVSSNLALQWCQNLDQLFAGVHRVLKKDGCFVFSTFGVNALKELKAAWATVDDYPHVNEFCSELIIRTALEKQGFCDIQIESHTYRSEYKSVLDLMRELKGIGAHNANQARKKTLTSKGDMKRMFTAYPEELDGGVKASFEIIYVMAKAEKK
ncbi:MAG: malonyl-ACP O-methyltransferase BioC [Methyloprofundus sp.]|nr:malonyl-ACP O-methyltransferase BioC [Methyloprofundus sp.]